MVKERVVDIPGDQSEGRTLKAVTSALAPGEPLPVMSTMETDIRII